MGPVNTKPSAILIAGPTASGKSGLAVEMAKQLGGRVINADSMQVYSVLRTITARPSDEEMRGVVHRLFGHIQPSQSYSVAKWLKDAELELAECRITDQVPVFVGGTGLYFKTLLEGLSAVPEIDPAIRRNLRDQSLADLSKLYGELQHEDPHAAKILEPGDTQRIVRALEVIRSTGKTLNFWQSEKKTGGILDPKSCWKITLLPARSVLHDRIRARFLQMVEAGALEEVEALMKLGLDREMPAMRAIGVGQMEQYLLGNLSLDEAIELSVIATRQYAKRQTTWIKHQLEEDWFSSPDPEGVLKRFLA